MTDKIKKLYWVLGVLVLSALLIGCESMKASSENNNRIAVRIERYFRSILDWREGLSETADVYKRRFLQFTRAFQNHSQNVLSWLLRSLVTVFAHEIALFVQISSFGSPATVKKERR